MGVCVCLLEGYDLEDTKGAANARVHVWAQVAYIQDD